MADANPIGLRAQDAPDSSETYVKDFVVPTDQAVHVDHEANERATRQEAFQHGLRTTGDISHRSAKDKPSKGSTTITYRAAAVLTPEADPDVVHQTVAGTVPVPTEEDETPAEETEGGDGSGEPLDPPEGVEGTTPAA